MTLTPPAALTLRETNPDVWYVDLNGKPFVFGADEIAFLKERGAASPRMRSRICAHADPDAPVHEMLIAHHRTCYVRPHRHTIKPETLIVIEGDVTAVFFDEHGAIRSSVELSGPPSQRAFSYRVPMQAWHTLIIRSEWLIFYEVAEGPFTPGSSEFPAWAPDGNNDAEAAAYIADLDRRLRG